jgi:hypothetical protein
MIRFLFLFLLVMSSSGACAEQPDIQKLQTGESVEDIVVKNGSVWLTVAGGQQFSLHYGNGQYSLAPLSPGKTHPQTRPDGILPDGVIIQGQGTIRRAWLSAPTRRYGHGILGDKIEAGAITAELASGEIVSLDLGDNAVFEDRLPRLVDVNNDGKDELLVVKSYLNRGAALTLVSAYEQSLAITAEAEPIGQPYRWLNPVGVADFDGDGINEIAAVITPHIGGTLQLYEWRGHQLLRDHAQYGFSNHQIGERNQDLSVITDLNNDGIMDMVLPDASRSALLGVTYRGGIYREMFRIPLGGAITSPVRSTDLNGDERDEIILAIEPATLIVLSSHP